MKRCLSLREVENYIMMKTLIVALNSKYIHTSLAPWYLKAFCSNGEEQLTCDIEVAEYTINDSLENILGSIYLKKPQIICFSCYIWNISCVLKLVRDIKKVSPQCTIILGGPEVSFDTGKLMKEHSSIDFIISGEGEKTFRDLLIFLQKTNQKESQIVQADQISSLDNIKGLTYRKQGEKEEQGEIIITEPCSLIKDLDVIPSPYTDEYLANLGNRIVYFESSRGCPFSCSYCLSSITPGVRYFSMDRVKKELYKLINWRVKQVKFVDRTFNSNKKRAKEIFSYIIDTAIKLESETNFHFEMAGDLFDEEMLDILSKAPSGLIQFEIGVQTTNQDSLKAIDRITDFEKIKTNVNKLRRAGNIHLHLDLIAGLPYENYTSFKKSFDDVYRLKPHQLQLGFLKMLKGSKMREQAELHSFEFRDYPPYEVLSNKYIKYEELLMLKGVEELEERYYNSGRFAFSLEYITEEIYTSPFNFYYQFSKFNEERNYLNRLIGAKELYSILHEFIRNSMKEEHFSILEDLLRLDFLKCDSSGRLPQVLRRHVSPSFRNRCFEFLQDETNIKKYLPEFAGQAAKEIFKRVHFQMFDYDITSQNIHVYPRKQTVILFDYSTKDRVTEWFKYYIIQQIHK
jgi:radical SAM superfamily enzyme YgiQ (UPF0313 family)